MADWPSYFPPEASGILSTAGPESVVAQYTASIGTDFATARAHGANIAHYVPVIVELQITIYQMSIIIGAQAGNVDVGIYNEGGTRLVSAGSTAAGAAGIQVFDVTDTILSPGCYYLTLVASTATTLTILAANPTATIIRGCGQRQQASALPLPSTATFAANAQGITPLINAHFTGATV